MSGVHIRLALFTDLGPAGHRLQRATPLPVDRFNFPDTEDGRKEVEKAAEKMNDYIRRHEGDGKGRR